MDARLQAIESGQPAASAGSTAPPVVAAGAVATPPPLQTIQPAAPAENNLLSAAPAESAGLGVDVQAPPAETETVVVEEMPPGDPANEKGSYQEAFTLLKAGNYDESIVGFKTFLAQDPNSTYADNAQYWLGEAYYVKAQYETAINEYSVLIQNYPESKKLTHAMLKIGYSYDELGMIDPARASLQDLIKRYPGTTAARLAEERLQRMALQQTP
jgi:tol-pal system protein YbgF